MLCAIGVGTDVDLALEAVRKVYKPQPVAEIVVG